MKLSRSVLPLFLAAAVVSGAGSVFAAGSQSDQQSSGSGYYGGQLSEAGQAKYDQIVRSYSEKFDKLNDELFVKNSELDAMQRAERPDPKEVRAKADEVVSVRRELRALSDEMNQKLEKEVFGPERKAAGQR